MKKYAAFIFALIINLAAFAQYKSDNVLFKTVDPADLCDALQKNQDYLLLDVRSPGEHYDTSSFASLNLGHFKGAKNIEVQQLANRWHEIEAYKDKPVFVYCSHSQRSRRASKLLADSGFTKIFNINGGMSAFHYNDVKSQGCLASLFETSNAYRIISFNELCSKMNDNPYLLDVRPDSSFRHISRDPRTNASGTIKGAVNIPLADLESRLGEIPKNGRSIIIMDVNGGDAAKAAVMLSKNGFTNISTLIEGTDRILSMDSRDFKCMNLYQSPVSYKTFNSAAFGRYVSGKDIVYLDVRSKDEFENKHKDAFRNIGHLADAINIPVDELAGRLGELDKNKEYIVYGFAGGPEAYKAADILMKQGFSKINVLVGGVFNLRWTAANVKGQGHLKNLVVDVPQENQ